MHGQNHIKNKGEFTEVALHIYIFYVVILKVINV